MPLRRAGDVEMLEKGLLEVPATTGGSAVLDVFRRAVAPRRRSACAPRAARTGTRRLAFLLLPVASACSSDGSISSPDSALFGSIASGEAAFRDACSACHANRDGFDLAFFAFPVSDVVRRGLGHVDRATAHDIAAFIWSVNVRPGGEESPPFQPGNLVPSDEFGFWEEAFGTRRWPDEMSADRLLSIDLRQLAVPFALPPWSDESGDGDWLPNHPLELDLTEPNGLTLAAALDAYDASPSLPRLLEALARFRAATLDGPDPVCRGRAGTHPEPRACFESRRWMASLAAQHFLRLGAPPAVPFAVAELWWQVGEVGATVFLREGGPPRHAPSFVAAWLYLAYSFAPAGFRDEFGYMGQFLALSNVPVFATFVNLRRMVDESEVHIDLPHLRYQAATLATTLAPASWKAHVAEFCYGQLLTRLSQGEIPTGQGRVCAASLVKSILREVEVSHETVDLGVLDRLRSMSAEILAALELGGAGPSLALPAGPLGWQPSFGFGR